MVLAYEPKTLQIFLGGPGFAKRRQGLTFEVNHRVVFMVSFFALDVFWKVLRGS